MGLLSFITAPFSSVVKTIGGVVSAGKAKAAAKINAANAAKQRAHDLKMANLAAQAQAGKPKLTQIIMIAAVAIGVIVLIFIMKKRR